MHIYHSHLDVHPPIRVRPPYRFEWHQDSGRQNREIEGDPRLRMSVKLGYWLSDVSEPGRGNLKVIPGSHLRNRISGPPRRGIEWPEPEGDHRWGHYPQTTLLHEFLQERGQLAQLAPDCRRCVRSLASVACVGSSVSGSPRLRLTRVQPSSGSQHDRDVS